MSLRDQALVTLRQQEPDLTNRILALKGTIPDVAVEDILDKVLASLTLVPRPHLSIIDKEFNLVAVSKEQERTFFPAGLDKAEKCFTAYNKFNARCGWCTAERSMHGAGVTWRTGVVSPETLGSRPDPDLVVSDVIAIPCGEMVGQRYSHCIEIVFLVTQRDQKRTERRFRNHQFMRILFSRLQENVQELTLHRLILMGALKAGSEHPCHWHLYVVDDTWQGAHRIHASQSIGVFPEIEEVWCEFLDQGRTVKLSEIASKIKVKHNTNPDQPEWAGLTAEAWLRLAEGRVERYHWCQKAVAFVRGSPEHGTRHFLLVMDKTEDNNFVTFEEMVSFSYYATFCHHVLANRKTYQERELMAREFNKLMDLSQQPLRDAFVGGMIISSAHTVSNRWKGNLRPAIESLLASIPETAKSKVQVQAQLTTCRSEIESLSEFFYLMERWRRMSIVGVEKVPVRSAIEAVLDRFRARFQRIGIKVFWPPKDLDVFVRADSTYLDEVITNLIQNACDALEDRRMPRIVISVEKVEDMVRINVEDNGPGFPTAEADSLWMPGYTTKTHGTGQGLAFIKYAVEVAFKGEVSCFSVPDERTVFSVQIPEWKEK